MEINGFLKRKFCVLEKHPDLYQAVTFCINDYLKNIIIYLSFWRLIK